MDTNTGKGRTSAEVSFLKNDLPAFARSGTGPLFQSAIDIYIC